MCGLCVCLTFQIVSVSTSIAHVLAKPLDFLVKSERFEIFIYHISSDSTIFKDNKMEFKSITETAEKGLPTISVDVPLLKQADKRISDAENS